jgi:hypothetical protein
MGSPIFSRPTPSVMKSTLYTVWFALSPKPEKLGDPKLEGVVWAFRIELALIVAMIVWGNLAGWLGPARCSHF